MESESSGSLQSSSGGGGGGGDDQEYDSRAESSPLSAFFNTNLPPQPPSHHHHHNPSIFDPLSNYFNPLSSPTPPQAPLSQPPQLNNTNQNPSLLNLDMIWSKTLRSDPGCTDLMTSFIPPSSSSNPSTQNANFHPSSFHINNSHPTPHNTNNNNSTNTTNMNSNNTTGVVRNPKKRSRASRRAPTTVLTTDTTNFRAMVQEFTGIPAPPFTSSSSPLFPRTRLDLFGTPSALRSSSTANNHPLLNPSPAPAPPYLLRPFPQKITNPPPFLSSSTTTTTTATTTSNSNTNSTSVNFQLQQSDLRHHNQNLLNINMQNQVLNLQSFLQTPSTNKYPISNSSPNMKPQGTLDQIPPSDDHHHHQSHHLKIGVLEELGLGHGGGLQNMESVPLDHSTLPMRRTENVNHSTSWAAASDGGGSNENHEHGKVSNLLSASSSEFHGSTKAGQEHAGLISRNSEGMLESWICSSD